MIGPIDLKKLSWLYEQNHIEKTNNNCYAYKKKTFYKMNIHAMEGLHHK
jgi:hypothetical protein